MRPCRPPLLYLSLYLKTHRTEYYRLLQAGRESGDWERSLEFFPHHQRRARRPEASGRPAARATGSSPTTPVWQSSRKGPHRSRPAESRRLIHATAVQGNPCIQTSVGSVLAESGSMHRAVLAVAFLAAALGGSAAAGAAQAQSYGVLDEGARTLV